jgi:hypothetical protein
MKPVTKDRILKTLDRISTTCHARDKFADVLRQATRNGMKAVLHGHVPSVDNDRLGLEMTIAGVPFPRSEEEVQLLITQKLAHYNHYHKWRDLVFEIQAHHKISGLEIETRNILGIDIEQPNICCSDGLPYILEDMPILQEYRPKIVAQFVQALRTHSITKCKKVITIQKPGKKYFDHVESIVEIEEILVAAALFDWASVWSDCGTPIINFGNGLDGTIAITGHVSFEGIKQWAI